MTDPSSEPQPRFFADRCLGRGSVDRLRTLGWSVVRIADVFLDDAQAITDEEWVAYGARAGMALLTKDKRIRYQPAFNAAGTPVFALSDGQLGIAEMTERFDAARCGSGVQPPQQRGSSGSSMRMVGSSVGSRAYFCDVSRSKNRTDSSKINSASLSSVATW